MVGVRQDINYEVWLTLISTGEMALSFIQIKQLGACGLCHWLQEEVR